MHVLAAQPGMPLRWLCAPALCVCAPCSSFPGTRCSNPRLTQPRTAELGRAAAHVACRYIVIPARPAGTEGWSEEQLLRLVTRDSMIGVATALTPDQVAVGGVGMRA